MSLSITVDNLRNVLDNISHMADKHVLIGIPDDENNRNDGTIGNAQLGVINENGSPARNIPARPFLIPGVAQAGPRATDAMQRFAAQGLTDPAAVERGLTAAGLIAQSAVKNRIVSQEGFAPLSAETLRRRAATGARGTKALIRTGQLLNSITFVIRDR